MVQPPAGWPDFKANAQADLYAEMGENGYARGAKMAAHARAIAMGTRDPSAKKTMLDIAADYDRLAEKSGVGATARERRTEVRLGRPLRPLPGNP